MLGVDGLEVLHVVSSSLTLVDDIARQRSSTQREQLSLELVVRTVVEETQRTASAGRIVDDLCHHGTVLLEEQLVADTYLTGRLYEHIPQAQFLVQLTQQEHLDLGIGLLLSAVETRREDFRVVEHDDIALAEIVHDIAEGQELTGVIAVTVLHIHVDSLALAVYDHHAAFVTMIHLLECSVFVFEDLVRRFQCNQVFRELKSEL